jgi:hypothetical protein
MKTQAIGRPVRMSSGRRQAAIPEQRNIVLRAVQVTFFERPVDPATVIEFKLIEFVDLTPSAVR